MNLDLILPPLLIAAAIGQLLIAGLNLRLDRLLAWDTELATVSLLLREVFHVHKWFISMILVLFGTLTIRFATEIGTGSLEIARWLAAGIGLFWAIRTVIQWAYYDTAHWRGKAGRTAVHWTLTIAYGGAAMVYLFAAFR
jgi:hypothetical protein